MMASPDPRLSSQSHFQAMAVHFTIYILCPEEKLNRKYKSYPRHRPRIQMHLLSFPVVRS